MGRIQTNQSNYKTFRMVSAHKEESYCERIMREVQESQARWAAEKAQRDQASEQQNALVASLSAQTDAVCERFDAYKKQVSNVVDMSAVRAGMQMARYTPAHIDAMWNMESKANKQLVHGLTKLMKPVDKAEQ